MTDIPKDVLDAFQDIGRAIEHAIHLSEEKDHHFDALAMRMTQSAAAIVGEVVVREIKKHEGHDPAHVADAGEAAIASCVNDFESWIRDYIVAEVGTSGTDDAQTAPTSNAIN